MGSDRTHREAVLARHAEQQFGAFTHEQALRAGFSPAAIKKRLARRLWVRVDYHVYKHAGTPVGWHQRLLAACLSGPAVASHRSAARLWEFPGMDSDLVEVTALRHRRRRAEDVVWHESYHLTPRDITEICGVQVTKPVRTFLDLGSVLSTENLEDVFNDGVRRNLLALPSVWQRLEQLGPLRRGAGRVRRVLESHVPGRRVPESVLETRFQQVLRSAGLPLPVGQHEVRAAGRVLARIDFAYPGIRLAIELDGQAYHYGARAERRDRDRENDLVALQWRVLRFDWKDVTERQEYVIATVRDALRATA